AEELGHARRHGVTCRSRRSRRPARGARGALSNLHRGGHRSWRMRRSPATPRRPDGSSVARRSQRSKLSGMSLADKVVLVTGAARGMGREYVRGFRKAGARVIATDLAWEPTGASSDHERFLEEVGNSPDVLAEYMDITIDSHVKRVFTKSVERFGTIDVIVNNAGMRQRDLYPPHGSVTTLATE